ncbi:RHS repeat-associated core domain-containing protein [Delftia sp. PE138]|uniref:RHS repeat-associated core domain-containing protein n=1 Tax=Delftia sp. PE138 TaxID=1812483 RepID=UPI0032D5729F
MLDLTWNADHQLIESNTTRHGVTQATRYAYDPLGRRVAKSDAFGSTHYLWDGDLMVHSQRGARQALYIYEPGSFVPLATIQGAGEEHSTYWYQCDQIGAPLELTDEEGEVAWAADYKVWGEAVMRSVLRTGTDDRPVSARAWGSKPVAPPPPPPIEQPFRFQGQQFDEETGLHYNRFRYYDPVVGRFVSQDPIGLIGGFNLYIYASTPTIWADILGLSSVKLGRSLRKAGRPALPDQSPHHIVQEKCNKNEHVKNSRAILARNNIGIDDAANGARLWGTRPSQIAMANHPGQIASIGAGTYHAGSHVHSDMNDKLIYQILKGVEKRGGNVEAALEDIGRRLESGSWKATFACCCS